MARNFTPATQRQLDTIEAASRRAGFADPQHAVAAAGIHVGNWRYDLSVPDASGVLDALARGLEPRPVTEATAEGGMSAADAVALLGTTVTITFTSRNEGSSRERTMRVSSVKQSMVDDTPALAGTLAGTTKDTEMRLSAITAWVTA